MIQEEHERRNLTNKKTKRFRNPLELLFHLPLIKQYLIVLFGRVQSLILFALQISFAMLRATSSFGLCPHSTQNPQVQNDFILDCHKSLTN